MEVKTNDTEKKEITPRLVIGIVPCLNNFFMQKAWEVIRPFVKKIAGETMGEYDEYKVWQDCFFGQAHLYMGYLDPTGTVEPKDYQEAFIKNLQKPDENFVGYVILKFEPKWAHIWQAYIVPQYQRTNVLKMSFEYIEKAVREVGAPYITFSSNKQGWNGLCKQLGFSETHTIYRKELGNG